MSEEHPGVYYTPREQQERDRAVTFTGGPDDHIAVLVRTVLAAEAQADARLGHCLLLEERLAARTAWTNELENKLSRTEAMLYDARRDYEAEKLRADTAEAKEDELRQGSHPDIALLQKVSDMRAEALDLREKLDVSVGVANFNKSQWDRYYKEFTDETLARSNDVNALQSELAATIKTSEGRLAVLKDKADELRLEWQRAERAEGELGALVKSIWSLVALDTDITAARQRLKEIRALLLPLLPEKKP